METQINDNTFLVVDVSLGEMVWTKGCNFDFEGWGYVQGIYDGGFVHVRLELPDEHPSMAEAVADTGMDSDQVELIDVIPAFELEHQDGRRVRAWHRAVTDAERAARARKRGYQRPSLPELDVGLRNRR